MELKPCPFCDGNDIIVDEYGGWDGNLYVVRCLDCALDYDSREEAINAWNRRPEEDKLQKRIVELEDALRKIAENEEVKECYEAHLFVGDDVYRDAYFLSVDIAEKVLKEAG